MPALFIGHGSPMNTLDDNSYTQEWRRIGRTLPRPRAILAVSAHWYFPATAVTAMPRPRTIHDFYGFPEELFEFDYPAPGLPDLAAEVVEIAKPSWIGLDRDQWGLDHGTWSVLAHMYPAADIPVLQLSINATQPLDYHLKLGAKLAALRKRGVLILASGNVVHNLKRLDWRNATGGADWARRFDEAALQQMTENPADILKLLEHPDYDKAVPTPDHFVPLLYLAGLAAENRDCHALIRGYAMQSLSMTSYGIGLGGDECIEGGESASLPPGIPADQTNL